MVPIDFAKSVRIFCIDVLNPSFFSSLFALSSSRVGRVGGGKPVEVGLRSGRVGKVKGCPVVGGSEPVGGGIGAGKACQDPWRDLAGVLRGLVGFGGAEDTADGVVKGAEDEDAWVGAVAVTGAERRLICDGFRSAIAGNTSRS